MNPYPYANQNPLRDMDPTGTCPGDASSSQGFEAFDKSVLWWLSMAPEEMPMEAFDESALWWLSMAAEEMPIEEILMLTGERRQPGDIFYDPDFNAWYGVMGNAEGGMAINDLLPDAWKAAQLNAINGYLEQYGSFPPGVTLEYLSQEYGLQLAGVIDSVAHKRAKAASTE